MYELNSNGLSNFRQAVFFDKNFNNYMKTQKVKKRVEVILSDMYTPVSIFLNARKQYRNSLLLEGTDFSSQENSYSFVCINPVASFTVSDNAIKCDINGRLIYEINITEDVSVPAELNEFVKSFGVEGIDKGKVIDGFFGYSSYDAVKYFEDINVGSKKDEISKIPDMRYSLYKYVIVINHLKNELQIHENLLDGELSELEDIKKLIKQSPEINSDFKLTDNEKSNLSDNEFIELVKKGKHHCKIGDVFQIVLSRQFSQEFKGDEFNVYRALRYINPSPYLFYFDYGDYKIFGSSPEAQIKVDNGFASINPIAGTYKRTGNYVADKKLAEELSNDPKENAEHVMLVDLARNDLSINCNKVKVDTFREVQFFSHVIHLVSTVLGELFNSSNPIQILADTFPAGTLSGAPKYKAMQLIEEYENVSRGFYGGAIGMIGFNGSINHAITIRSFLSKNNQLIYRAGAGVVDKSIEINELNEVNNKLLALKNAITMAENL